MTQITVTKNIGGHAKGDSIHTSPGAAAYLIDTGHAEAVEVKAESKPKAKPTPAKGVAGGSSAKVEVTAG